MAPKTKTVDVRDLINNKLVENERNLSWLQRKTDIPYGSLYSILKQKVMDINQTHLKLINSALETDFTL
jgi:predicted transcriptional regulator